MKAVTAVCATGASVPAIVNGRISRHRDGENAEIQMYLSKLKDLVPFMPKNKKLSKLEVIQNVIDYICELQTTLETTGNAGTAAATFDPAAALRGGSLSPRQPLGIRSSPNKKIQRRRSSHQHHNSSSSSPINNCDLNTIVHTTSDKHGGDWSS